MNKKLTFGKLLGIIFCIIAAACTVVLLFANAYFGGQMKLIDKFYTALERDDFEGVKTCFGEEITEQMFLALRFELYVNLGYENDNETLAHFLSPNLQDDEDALAEKDIHTKVKFVSREKFYDCYMVYYDLTIYNDEEQKEFDSRHMPLKREGGKWVIDL